MGNKRDESLANKQTAPGGRSASSPAKAPPPRRTPAAGTSHDRPGGRAGKSPASAPKKTAPTGQTPLPKPKSRVTPRRPAIEKRPSLAQRALRNASHALRALTTPAFWRARIKQLPPWVGELGALLLIVAGFVMLTALLNPSSEASFAATISRIERQLFGDGAYLFALGVLATGVILLLPRFDIRPALGWARIAAGEVAFGSLLALLHLAADDPQPRALAHDGRGGGYVGWALMQLTSSLGRTLSFALFGLLFAAALLIALRMRLWHVLAAVAWLRDQLQVRIADLNVPPGRLPDDLLEDDGAAQYGDPPGSPSPPPGFAGGSDSARAAPPQGSTRRTPDHAGRASTESVRSAGEKPAADATIVPGGTAAPGTGPTSNGVPRNGGQRNGQLVGRPLNKAERREIADHARRTMGATNGRSLVAPGEPGDRPSVVPRELLPDARAVPAVPRARIHQKGRSPDERYFTVQDFRENKKIGKRDESLPPLELLNELELNKPTEEEINTNARIIRNTLLEFDVEVEVIDVKVGPTVTQYAVSPYTEQVTEEGDRVLNRVRVSEVTNLANDLALALSAKRLRIQAPVPGHSYMGIEVPNRHPSIVALRPVLESETFYRFRHKPLALPLGRDVSGDAFVADLASMPHLLIAGTTGSGKSIMLAAMTTALVTNNTPDRVRLVLLDPKMVELSRFNGLPHLLGPVETDLDRIIGVLRWATREMDRRYKLLEKEAARNLEIYNASLGRRRKDEVLPYIVLIIDEIGDLMMQRPDETERALTRLAQMARAVGIHLMVATQRPSVDVITGLIKANFPARISFAVASSVDSRVILDTGGAESLMGRGDMLFLAPDASGPQRLQCCYISDEEVHAVVQHWQNWTTQQAEAGLWEAEPVAPWERGMTRREVLAETDPMLEDAIKLIVEEGEASASLLQRRLGLGYPRAARVIDLMHELGIVGAARPGGRSREVLVKPGADPFQALLEKRMKANKPAQSPPPDA